MANKFNLTMPMLGLLFRSGNAQKEVVGTCYLKKSILYPTFDFHGSAVLCSMR